MSYLGPSPRPGRRGPRRHSGAGPFGPCPAPMAGRARPGGPLRWPTTHGPAPRSDGRPPMARRPAPMAGRPWPGAPLRWQAAHGPARASHADRFRGGPDAGQYWKGNWPAPARNRPALAGNTPALTATHHYSQATHRYSRQPASPRGNRPALTAAGQHSRQPGPFCQVWGQGSLASFSCLRASSVGAYRGREAAGRAAPAIATRATTNTGR
jgi:hypothetical protein